MNENVKMIAKSLGELYSAAMLNQAGESVWRRIEAIYDTARSVVCETPEDQARFDHIATTTSIMELQRGK